MRQGRERRGLSLLEVLFSSILVAVTMATIFGMLQSGYASLDHLQQQARGLALAERVIAFSRATLSPSHNLPLLIRTTTLGNPAQNQGVPFVMDRPYESADPVIRDLGFPVPAPGQAYRVTYRKPQRANSPPDERLLEAPADPQLEKILARSLMQVTVDIQWISGKTTGKLSLSTILVNTHDY